MLDSITKYVGNAVEKGKKNIISVVDSVKTLKDIALLLNLITRVYGNSSKSYSRCRKKIGLELQKKKDTTDNNYYRC
jgi:hypothetical protein